MKKNLLQLTLTLLTVVVLTGASTLSFAQQPHQPHHPGHNARTSITVNSDYEGFWLFIDDILQNEQPAKSVRLDQVPEGEHYLRVEMSDPEHHTVGQLVYINPANNRFLVEKQRHLYGISIGRGVPRPEVVMPLVAKQNNHPQGYSGRGYHYPNVTPTPPAPPAPPAPMVMNAEDFQIALGRVKSENFESNRLTAAKRIVNSSYFTVGQIEQLCRLLEFDSNRLEFVKYAYPRCVEPAKYFMLRDLFTFDSHKQELDKFLDEQQH